MVGKSGAIIPAVLDAYDFGRFATIADIGGGHGHLLRAILQRIPTGVRSPLRTAARHRRCLRRVDEWLRLAAGDFFTDPLPVADTYICMEVIHDWADEKAIDILTAVRRVAPSHARVLLIESLVTESPGAHFSKTLDVLMLAITGGGGTGAGLELRRCCPLPGSGSSVSFRPGRSTRWWTQSSSDARRVAGSSAAPGRITSRRSTFGGANASTLCGLVAVRFVSAVPRTPLNPGDDDG